MEDPSEPGREMAATRGEVVERQGSLVGDEEDNKTNTYPMELVSGRVGWRRRSLS